MFIRYFSLNYIKICFILETNINLIYLINFEINFKNIKRKPRLKTLWLFQNKSKSYPTFNDSQKIIENV